MGVDQGQKFTEASYRGAFCCFLCAAADSAIPCDGYPEAVPTIQRRAFGIPIAPFSLASLVAGRLLSFFRLSLRIQPIVTRERLKGRGAPVPQSMACAKSKKIYGFPAAVVTSAALNSRIKRQTNATAKIPICFLGPGVCSNAHVNALKTFPRCSAMEGRGTNSLL